MPSINRAVRAAVGAVVTALVVSLAVAAPTTASAAGPALSSVTATPAAATPSPTASSTPRPTPSASSPTPTATPSPTPTATPSPTPTAPVASTPTPTPTPSASASPTPSATPTPTPTPTRGTLSISGTISVPAGATLPKSGVTVTVFDRSAWTTTGITAQVAANGTYRIPRLAAGSYALRVDVPSGSGLLGEWYNDKADRYSADPVDVLPDADRTGVNVTLSRAASISGTVSVPSGVAASGVSVIAYDASHGWAGSAAVGSDGRYTLPSLPAGSFRLQFDASDASGLLDEWYDDQPTFESSTAITVASGEKRVGADATMVKAATISGRITVPSDVSIGPWSFRVVVFDAQQTNGQQRWVRDAYVAADGTYRLPGLRAGSYRLQFAAPTGVNVVSEWYADATDFASATPLTVALGEEKTGIDATLVAGVTISGTVTLPADLSPASTTISVGASTASYMMVGSAQVAADGTYRIVGLPAGTYRVQFRPPSTSPLVSEWWNDAATFDTATPVTLSAGQGATGIDAVLERGAAVSGRIIVPEGYSAGNIRVTVSPTPWDQTFNTWTAPDGTYRLEGIRPGTYRLSATPPSGSALMSEWFSDKSSFSAADPITLAGGDARTGVDMSLDVGGAVTGTVTVPSGMSLGTGSSAVRVVANPEGSGSPAITTSVNPDGSYALLGVPAGAYRIMFDAPTGSGLVDQWYDKATSYASSVRVVVTAGQTRSGVDAALSAGVSISGRVTLPAGVSIDSMQYRVSAYGENFRWVAGTSLNSDGTYTLSELPPGSYRLSFDVPNGSDVRGQWYTGKNDYWSADWVTVTAGSAKTGVDATLVKAAKISGKVLSDTGSAAANTSVTAWRRDGATWRYQTSVQTDAAGAYAFGGLPAGTYTLNFQPRGGSGLLPEWWRDSLDQATATTVSVSAGQTRSNLVATLDRGATISGSARYASGAPLTGAEVRVIDRNGSPVGRASVDQSGRYSVTGIEGVSVAVAVVGAGGLVFEGGATTLSAAPFRALTRGSTTTVDLTVAGRTVSGTVRVTGTNALFTTGTVTLASAVGAEGMKATIGSDGRYRLVGVPAGAYVARVDSSDAAYATTWSDGANAPGDADYFRVVSSNVTKNLTVAPAASLAVTTAATSGWPWVQVLRWNGASFDYVSGQSVAAGARAQFTGLAPGEYSLRINDVYLGGQRVADRATRVTLASGDAADVGVFSSTPADGGALRGTITGAGGADVRIVAVDSAGNETSTVSTTTGGKTTYSFPALPTGTYTVRAEVTGMPSAWFGGSSASTARVLTVTTGGQITADIRVAAGTGTLVGTVTAARGTATGLTVVLTENGSSRGSTWVASATTDARGAYRFSRMLVPGRAYEVRVSAGTDTPGASSAFTAVAGAQRRDLALVAPSRLSGAVVDDASGAAVVGAMVQAVPDGSTDTSYSARTDSRGRYDFSSLPAGVYRVRFGVADGSGGGDSGGGASVASAYAPQWLPGSPTAEGASTITIAAGASASAPTMRVTASGVITGRIAAKLASGSTVWLSITEVTVQDAAGRQVVNAAAGQNDSPGSFSVAVAPGTYTVCASLPRWMPEAARFPRTCRSTTVTVAAGQRAGAGDLTLTETRATAASSRGSSTLF